jgi:hypothetical protein
MASALFHAAYAWDLWNFAALASSRWHSSQSRSISASTIIGVSCSWAARVLAGEPAHRHVIDQTLSQRADPDRWNWQVHHTAPLR